LPHSRPAPIDSFALIQYTLLQRPDLHGQLTKTTRILYTMDREDRFEWHKKKAVRNYSKHRVSFEEARGVFRDAFAVEKLDDREDYGEERYTLIGILVGKDQEPGVYAE
jgi:uncharacterized DUF497 family protein